MRDQEYVDLLDVAEVTYSTNLLRNSLTNQYVEFQHKANFESVYTNRTALRAATYPTCGLI